MAEARANAPDQSPNHYYGETVNIREKIDALLKSLPAETQQAIAALAKADAATRKSALSQLDSQTRSTIETILENL